MSNSFKELISDVRLHEVLDTLGFETPTEVQKAVLPLLMNQNSKDLLGQAQTGTGKTLAFGLPLLNRVDVSFNTPQGIVVVPTRELALQVFDSLKPFARALGIEVVVLYGGMSIADQIARLRRGVHIVIGTPGRINDHVVRGTLELSSLKTFVLDEADIMFDMGFRSDIEQLIASTNQTRELWLFTATIKDTIRDFTKKYMKDPVTVSISGQKVSSDSVAQYYALVPFSARMRALARFIDREYKDFYGFVFCQTKILTAEVADDLVKRGYRAGALHGDMGQDQRNLMIKKFREGELKILVATDVAARGIDIPDLTHVFNYSVPEDQETYVHRIGRTGRAGKKGIAITFVSKSEMRMLEGIKRKFNVQVSSIAIPTREEIADARLVTATDFIASALQTEHPKDELNTKIASLLGEYDAEACKNLAVKLLQDKFFKDINADQDIPEISLSAGDSKAGIVEVAVNIGLEDGVGIDVVKDHIRASVKLDSKKMPRIRVARNKTFVDLATECVDQFISDIQSTFIADKPLTVSIVGPSSNRFERGGRERNFSGERSRGGARSYNGSGSRRRSSNTSFGGGSRDYSSGRDSGREYAGNSRDYAGNSRDYTPAATREEGFFGSDRSSRGPRANRYGNSDRNVERKGGFRSRGFAGHREGGNRDRRSFSAE